MLVITELKHFVERANRTLGEKIFSHQYAQELIREGQSREWVKRLPGLIKNMNNSSTRILGSDPSSAIKLKEIGENEKNYKRVVGLKEERLPSFAKVRYLLAPGEEEGGDKRRATDAIWSLKVFELKRSVVSHDQPVLYFLSNVENDSIQSKVVKKAPKRGFVREELQVVPENSELPPASILKS